MGNKQRAFDGRGAASEAARRPENEQRELLVGGARDAPPQPRLHSTFAVSVDLVRSALRSEDCGDIPSDQLRRDFEDYESFLLLIQRHPGLPLAPTKSIDRMWHLHMLHPRAYHDDCVRLFGEILDHDGGFGATDEEAPVLARTFALTAALWEQAYGVPYLGDTVACKRNCVSRCQRRCKTMDPAFSA